MSFDGVFTHSMVHELTETLVSGRISKSINLMKTVVLVIRAKGKTINYYYQHIPVMRAYNYLQLPIAIRKHLLILVMMLRKFLDGAILETIQQIENDRVIHFTFSKEMN